MSSWPCALALILTAVAAVTALRTLSRTDNDKEQ